MMIRTALLTLCLGLTACGPSVSLPARLPVQPQAPAVRAQSNEGLHEAMVVMAKRQLELQDKNKDGVVSRTEWWGWDNDFVLGDRNRDGKITQAEYTELMTSQLSIDTYRSIMRREFEHDDLNKDGRVNGAEWAKIYKTFTDKTELAQLPWQPFDKNADQGLDQIEFEDAYAYYWARHD